MSLFLLPGLIFFIFAKRYQHKQVESCRRAPTTLRGLIQKASLSSWAQNSLPSPKDTKTAVRRSYYIPPSPRNSWWLGLGKPLFPSRYHQRHQINRADQNNITQSLKIKLPLKPQPTSVGLRPIC